MVGASGEKWGLAVAEQQFYKGLFGELVGQHMPPHSHRCSDMASLEGPMDKHSQREENGEAVGQHIQHLDLGERNHEGVEDRMDSVVGRRREDSVGRRMHWGIQAVVVVDIGPPYPGAGDQLVENADCDYLGMVFLSWEKSGVPWFVVFAGCMLENFKPMKMMREMSNVGQTIVKIETVCTIASRRKIWHVRKQSQP